VRQRSGHLRDKLSALRQRMQNTAANVDQKMRLEHRITEALAALLSQKTVSGILHTCATIGRSLMLLYRYEHRASYIYINMCAFYMYV
jgi:hypothetical protein